MVTKQSQHICDLQEEIPWWVFNKKPSHDPDRYVRIQFDFPSLVYIGHQGPLVGGHHHQRLARTEMVIYRTATTEMGGGTGCVLHIIHMHYQDALRTLHNAHALNTGQDALCTSQTTADAVQPCNRSNQHPRCCSFLIECSQNDLSSAIEQNVRMLECYNRMLKCQNSPSPATEPTPPAGVHF